MTLPAVEASALVVTFMDNCARRLLMGNSNIYQCQRQSQRIGSGFQAHFDPKLDPVMSQYY